MKDIQSIASSADKIEYDDGNPYLPEKLDFSRSGAFTKGHFQYKNLEMAYTNSEIYYGRRPDFSEMMEYIISYSKDF